MASQAFAKKLKTHSSKKLSDSKENNTTPGHGRTPPSLYRHIGNQAMNRLMEGAQNKEGQQQDHLNNQGANLKENVNEMMPVLRKRYGISEPVDPVEQEATSVANQIVNMQPSEDNGARVKTNHDLGVWRSPPINRKQGTSQNTYSAVDLDLPTSDGLPLDRSVATYMEPRFGYSFKDVRIHTNSQSADISHHLNASAFTTGKDIYFGQGRYNPQTKDGKMLIAHELTHVIQQGQASQINKSTISMTKAPMPEKTVTVNITYLHGGSTSLSSHLAYASTVYSQAKVKIVKGSEVTLDEPKSKAVLGTNLTLDLDAGYPTTPSSDQTNLLKENRASGQLTMYYVKEVTHPLVGGVLGCAWWPATGQPVGFSFGATSPERTWPHELGHVLLDTGGHPEKDNDNFMAQTSVATGKDTMTPTQITTIRGSSLVK